MSHELKEFLNSCSVPYSRSTPYNPEGNGQVERLNGTLWKTVNLFLKSQNLSTNRWQEVLASALHSVHSLLCTSTNCTPHERMFSHHRNGSWGVGMPSWISKPGTVLLRKHVRSSKYDSIVEPVELLEANAKYAHVKLPNGRETTVSLKHLAPAGKVTIDEK